MHVLKSLRAQLIAQHYMNGFCPNFSRRLLREKIHRKMTQPTHLGACTHAHIEKLSCTAYNSALHEWMLPKFQP